MSNTPIQATQRVATGTLVDELSPLIARLYANRGINSPEQCDLSLKSLAPHDSMSNIDAAAALLEQAVREQLKVVIVGDFDADGATSSALGMLMLQAFGLKNVDYLVPNRFDFGYGLTPEIVEVAARSKPGLIVTVDNGISSIAGVEKANQLGIKVLITDHHLPGSDLPKAAAIVNPNLTDDQFPSKNLAGVGVIFYLMLALRQRLEAAGWFETAGIAKPNAADYLDLVALGTVADVVALDHNNRILVSEGLRRIRAGRCRAGIRALLTVGKRDYRKAVASDMGFAVGPRLNAAGRLEDMSLGIQCLLAEDESSAMRIAAELNQLNLQRRDIEAGMQEDAERILEQELLVEDGQLSITLFDPAWHQGVVGLLASRIKEQYHRPVVIFAAEQSGGSDSPEMLLKGSARSVKGVHIRDCMADVDARHPMLIEKFGGHAMAAGLSIKRTALETFAEALERAVETRLDGQSLARQIETDGSLKPSELSLLSAREVASAGPWGQGFPEPVFDGEFRILEQRIVGEHHMKLTLSSVANNQDEQLIVDAIMFQYLNNGWHEAPAARFLYQLEVNEFRGSETVQLNIRQMLPVQSTL